MWHKKMRIVFSLLYVLRSPNSNTRYIFQVSKSLWCYFFSTLRFFCVCIHSSKIRAGKAGSRHYFVCSYCGSNVDWMISFDVERVAARYLPYGLSLPITNMFCFWLFSKTKSFFRLGTLFVTQSKSNHRMYRNILNSNWGKQLKLDRTDEAFIYNFCLCRRFNMFFFSLSWNN